MRSFSVLLTLGLVSVMAGKSPLSNDRTPNAILTLQPPLPFLLQNPRQRLPSSPRKTLWHSTVAPSPRSPTLYLTFWPLRHLVSLAKSQLLCPPLPLRSKMTRRRSWRPRRSTTVLTARTRLRSRPGRTDTSSAPRSARCGPSRARGLEKRRCAVPMALSQLVSQTLAT